MFYASQSYDRLSASRGVFYASRPFDYITESHVVFYASQPYDRLSESRVAFNASQPYDGLSTSCVVRTNRRRLLRQSAGKVHHEGHRLPAASLAVVEDDDEVSGCDDCGCEVLPKLGGRGSEETVKDLKFSEDLSTGRRRELREFAGCFSLFSVIALVRRYCRSIALS
ncbi:hypothetical protein PoB_006136700 [Plakobranchus ocellatus]|uniref:Uncharacterized protein n=1 Tax=Plakobranchus ocellatus TaxID=259542 RepID=A0AAV4CSL4_9GAST|nr:hypothetical protein PoB_006136700 [Plakobranchus ocellatus]